MSGAPSGFTPELIGAGACPASTSSGMACENPQYAFAVNGQYSLSLSPGSWEVSGFYENAPLGGVFLSPPATVTIPSGGTVTQNFVVPYQSPATLKGKISVTGVPSGVTVYELNVLLCPSFAPYTGGAPSIACVNGYGQPTAQGVTSGTYDITGLPPGQWTAYPGYCTQFGCATNANAGKSVTLVAGRTAHANLKTPFLVPSEGLLAATVTVTGAPSGFADQVGISACQGSGPCETFYAYQNNTISLTLPNGQWSLQGFYVVPPFDNTVNGPTYTATISGGQTTTVDVTVPYQVLGGVTGTIKVTGKGTGTPVTSYTVLACPGSAATPSSECINEYSGPGGFGYLNTLTRPMKGARNGSRGSGINQYQLATLTPGPWTLYPGYGTAFGSFTSPTGTTVNIVAGQTAIQNLRVAYQPPSVGTVTGKVTVIDVPANNFEAGVQACTAPPTGTSCSGEQFAYPGSDGSYTLSLAPGTWWVSGFVDVFAYPTVNQTTSPPQVITVTAGSHTKANFTVRAAPN